jgi:hypothetical protein
MIVRAVISALKNAEPTAELDPKDVFFVPWANGTDIASEGVKP